MAIRPGELHRRRAARRRSCPRRSSAAIRAVGSAGSGAIARRRPGASRGTRPRRRRCPSRPCRRSALASAAGGTGEPCASRPREDRRGERMARAGLERGRQRQHLAARLRRTATTSVTFGLPSVSVPVLSKATAVTLPEALQHGAALHQQAAPGAGRQRRRRWPPASRSPARRGSRSAAWPGPCRPIRPSGSPSSSGGTIATSAPTTRTPGV